MDLHVLAPPNTDLSKAFSLSVSYACSSCTVVTTNWHGAWIPGTGGTSGVNLSDIFDHATEENALSVDFPANFFPSSGILDTEVSVCGTNGDCATINIMTQIGQQSGRTAVLDPVLHGLGDAEATPTFSEGVETYSQNPTSVVTPTYLDDIHVQYTAGAQAALGVWIFSILCVCIAMAVSHYYISKRNKARLDVLFSSGYIINDTLYVWDLRFEETDKGVVDGPGVDLCLLFGFDPATVVQGLPPVRGRQRNLWERLGRHQCSVLQKKTSYSSVVPIDHPSPPPRELALRNRDSFFYGTCFVLAALGVTRQMSESEIDARVDQAHTYFCGGREHSQNGKDPQVSRRRDDVACGSDDVVYGNDAETCDVAWGSDDVAWGGDGMTLDFRYATEQMKAMLLQVRSRDWNQRATLWQLMFLQAATGFWVPSHDVLAAVGAPHSLLPRLSPDASVSRLSGVPTINQANGEQVGHGSCESVTRAVESGGLSNNRTQGKQRQQGDIHPQGPHGPQGSVCACGTRGGRSLCECGAQWEPSASGHKRRVDDSPMDESPMDKSPLGKRPVDGRPVECRSKGGHAVEENGSCTNGCLRQKTSYGCGSDSVLPLPEWLIRLPYPSYSSSSSKSLSFPYLGASTSPTLPKPRQPDSRHPEAMPSPDRLDLLESGAMNCGRTEGVADDSGPVGEKSDPAVLERINKSGTVGGKSDPAVLDRSGTVGATMVERVWATALVCAYGSGRGEWVVEHVPCPCTAIERGRRWLCAVLGEEHTQKLILDAGVQIDSWRAHRSRHVRAKLSPHDLLGFVKFVTKSTKHRRLLYVPRELHAVQRTCDAAVVVAVILNDLTCMVFMDVWFFYLKTQTCCDRLKRHLCDDNLASTPCEEAGETFYGEEDFPSCARLDDVYSDFECDEFPREGNLIDSMVLVLVALALALPVDRIAMYFYSRAVKSSLPNRWRRKRIRLLKPLFSLLDIVSGCFLGKALTSSHTGDPRDSHHIQMNRYYSKVPRRALPLLLWGILGGFYVTMTLLTLYYASLLTDSISAESKEDFVEMWITSIVVGLFSQHVARALWSIIAIGREVLLAVLEIDLVRFLGDAAHEG
eukprot:Rmarinus@m.16586